MVDAMTVSDPVTEDDRLRHGWDALRACARDHLRTDGTGRVGPAMVALAAGVAVVADAAFPLQSIFVQSMMGGCSTRTASLT